MEDAIKLALVGGVLINIIKYVVGALMIVAVFILWRNSNRTNKLLGEIAKSNGVSEEVVSKINASMPENGQYPVDGGYRGEYIPGGGDNRG